MSIIIINDRSGIIYNPIYFLLIPAYFKLTQGIMLFYSLTFQYVFIKNSKKYNYSVNHKRQTIIPYFHQIFISTKSP